MTARVACQGQMVYHAGCVVHGSLSCRGLSCAMYGGEAACTCFLARSYLLTLGLRRLKHGVQGFPADQPLFSDFHGADLTSLDLARERIRSHAQDFRRLGRREQLLRAHTDDHLLPVWPLKRVIIYYIATYQ
jgi:hypothetical protein